MMKLLQKLPLFFLLTLYGALSMAKPSLIASSFNAPTGIAFNRSGEMYVTNWSDDSVVKITRNGKREIIHNGISSPAGITIDSNNNIYVASYSGNYILKIDNKGISTKISEGYSTPTGIAFSNTGQLLITNRSNGEIISLDTNSGEKRIIAKGLNLPVGVTQLPDGSLVVSQYSGRLTLIAPSGKQKELGSTFNRPGVGIITESKDTVIVIDNGAGAVRRVNVQTGKTELLTDKLSSAVALAHYQNRYYVGSWEDGSIYVIDKSK